jgi:hypothetical protein
VRYRPESGAAKLENGMDLINEKEIFHSGEICAQCGSNISSSKNKELRLCSVCFEERSRIEDNLRSKMRRNFNLEKALSIRRCLLEVLVSHEVDLDPSGWRMGLAVACELRDAGLDHNDSKQILIQAGGKAKRVNRLLDVVYGKRIMHSLSCDQIKAFTMACKGCSKQFQVKEKKENVTEIIMGPVGFDLQKS